MKMSGVSPETYVAKHTVSTDLMPLWASFVLVGSVFLGVLQTLSHFTVWTLCLSFGDYKGLKKYYKWINTHTYIQIHMLKDNLYSSMRLCVYTGKSSTSEPINCGVEQKSRRLSFAAFTICRLQFQLDWNLYLAEWFCEINNFWRRPTTYNKYLFFLHLLASSFLPSKHLPWSADSEAGGIFGLFTEEMLLLCFPGTGISSLIYSAQLVSAGEGEMVWRSWCPLCPLGERVRGVCLPGCLWW